MHKRQFFLQLEAGEYTSMTVRTNLRAKMEELVGLDGDFTGVEEVHVDINVLCLVAHEALSNARKYRDRHTPIRITAHVISKDDGPHAILSLRITSTNDVRVPRLSDKKCIAVFKTGVKANSLSSTSDGLGLNNAAVAIKAAHGRVWLSTSTDASGDHTHMHCELPVSEWPPAPVSTPSVDACERPSWVPKHRASRQDPTALPTSLMHESGSRSDKDNQNPGPSAIRDGRRRSSAPASTKATRQPFVCIGLDDTPMLRKMHMHLFKLFVGADMERSGSMGATRDEIIGFIDVVMGWRDLQMQPVNLAPADVAVIDQNLCDDMDEVVILGEEIAQQLRERGFKGVICLLTGSNQKEINRLSHLPHVDLAYGKSTDLRVLAEKIIEKSQSPA